MKRDFLKDLGIEDKDIITKILDENSADIGRAKGELDTYKTKVTDLENEIKDKDSKIAQLEKDNAEVTTLREQVATLEADKTKLQNDLDTEVTKLQKNHAIESGVRDANAKNVKAVMALLDMNKITLKDGVLEGLDSQLKTLTEGEDTSFLFGVKTPKGLTQPNPPNPNPNPPTAKTFSDAVKAHLSGGTN